MSLKGRVTKKEEMVTAITKQLWQQPPYPPSTTITFLHLHSLLSALCSLLPFSLFYRSLCPCFSLQWLFAITLFPICPYLFTTSSFSLGQNLFYLFLFIYLFLFAFTVLSPSSLIINLLIIFFCLLMPPGCPKGQNWDWTFSLISSASNT